MENEKKKIELTPEGYTVGTIGVGTAGMEAIFPHLGMGGLVAGGVLALLIGGNASMIMRGAGKLKGGLVKSQPKVEATSGERTLGEKLLGLNKPGRRNVDDRVVDLGDDLQLDIDDIAGKALFICGIRRSGKTTLGVRIAEQMGKFNMPMLIPDLKGDWLSCIDTLPNAVILRQGEATEKNAVSHGWAICEEGLQIILDVASYDDMNEVAVVIAGMIAGVFHWEKKHLDSRRLCAIFLDEAQSYLPQDVKDSIISEPVARDAMMNAYMQVLAVGGSLGLFPVILTQRISQVAKKIVAQSELVFLLKQTMDLDINRYQSFTTVPKEKIRALKQGQGIFVDIEGVSSIHMFHKRTSSDSMSRTPSVNVPQKSAAPVSKQPIEDYDDLPDLWVENEQDEEELPVVPAKRQVTASRHTSEDDRKVKRAYQYWQQGHNSVRKLEDVSGWSNGETRRIIRLMKEQGLVE